MHPDAFRKLDWNGRKIPAEYVIPCEYIASPAVLSPGSCVQSARWTSWPYASSACSTSSASSINACRAVSASAFTGCSGRSAWWRSRTVYFTLVDVARTVYPDPAEQQVRLDAMPRVRENGRAESPAGVSRLASMRGPPRCRSAPDRAGGGGAHPAQPDGLTASMPVSSGAAPARQGAYTITDASPFTVQR